MHDARKSRIFVRLNFGLPSVNRRWNDNSPTDFPQQAKHSIRCTGEICVASSSVFMNNRRVNLEFSTTWGKKSFVLWRDTSTSCSLWDWWWGNESVTLPHLGPLWPYVFMEMGFPWLFIQKMSHWYYPVRCHRFKCFGLDFSICCCYFLLCFVDVSLY